MFNFNLSVKIYRSIALKDDIDKYWLFVYEILSEDDLTGDYKCIKKKKVSFIKEDYK